MKKFNLLTVFAATAFLFAFIMSSCTKEGPAGADGLNGQDGTNGQNGQDGTAGCVKCHDDSQQIAAASLQWEASGHATGSTFERNDVSCAPCHTSQGFVEVMQSGAMETTEPIANPASVNCYTCHKIHQTYTEADWAFQSNGAVQFWINGAISDQGKGNLCINCHQPRIPDPLPVPNGGEVSIASAYWGPHHGPQGTMMAGTGGYEVEGSMSYTNSKHTDLVENSCVSCHMAAAYGSQAGGHTMGMTYLYHGHGAISEAGCVQCHEGDDLDALVEDSKAEIDALLADLRTVLLEQGALDSANHVVPGTLTANQAGGVLNYLMVLEDRSGGTHNNKYAKALLNNSIESLN